MMVAKGLTKSYGGRPVVSSVDLTLEPGRVVGLVGANGAGKTTTIKMLAGLVKPTSGRAEIDGRATTEPQARTSIGYLPEDSPLYDDENAVSYLIFFGSLYGLDRAESRKRAERLLDSLRLDRRHWKKTIGTLSKGMRRKVAIARTLLHGPAVVLLDEPTSGLDPFTAREVDEAVRRLRSEGKAILLSAHNLAQIEELCDEIVIVHEGVVVTRGTLADLRTQWGTQTYSVRSTVPFPGSRPDGQVHVATYDNLPRVEQAMEAIRAAAGIVLEVQAVPPRLDEILRKAAGA
jgi:ABC-2 type transport system ATP-binding protein